uniref:Uncharacterized protein n=1 Tax=Rousettus aegyptiacus TaxID=9407 RepID=A0A7J8DHS0_ROUAE|nr:hypothetical protein HJG63_008590 [Rousettus aegyptiacus]
MGRLKAKRLQSLEWRGIEKKQSLRSMTSLRKSRGMATGEGIPGCKAPIGTMVLLTALRSCKRRHFPERFCMTNIGVFQGDVDGSMCPAASCSCTNSMAASSFLWGRGHWSIQTGLSFFQVILSAWCAGGAMALTKNGY